MLRKKLLIALMLSISFQIKANQCSDKNLQLLVDDTNLALTAAEKKPYKQFPCKETSSSDREILTDEINGLIEDLLGGKVPNPVLTGLKAFFTPSQIGTSSEMCYGPSKESETAKYQLGQLKRILADCD